MRLRAYSRAIDLIVIASGGKNSTRENMEHTMQRIIDWWTVYHDWASNLDSESRFCVIAGSLVLISIYAILHISPAHSSQESSAPAKIKKARGNDRRR